MRGKQPTGQRRGGAFVLALLLVAVMTGSSNAESTSINASVRIASVEVTLSLSTLAARVGDTVRAQVAVTNLGSTLLSTVTVELRGDSPGLSVRGAVTATVSRLKAGHTTTLTWKLCALQEGNYVVLARATADGASVDSTARVVSIAGRRIRGCT